MIIHSFLYDPDFVNTTTILDPALKTGGICVLSPPGLSYFVTPQEFPDERSSRANNLNVTLTGKPRLIFDQSQYASFATDIQTLWTLTERENIFAIIDYLAFAYQANATSEQIELALAAWPQYLTASYVYSTTKTSATVYSTVSPTAITCPDYISFTYVANTGTQYQMRVWLSNTVFMQGYPLSTIAAVVPPLPLTQLYTLDIVNGIGNIFATALAASVMSQQTLQSFIQSAEYSGYCASDVKFVDNNNNYTTVQFNILYKGPQPGTIAIRTAIRDLLLNSGVGDEAGWKQRAPSLFVTELWYLVPMWDNATLLIDVQIYTNIVVMQTAITDATTVLHDLSSGFITSNLDIISVFYNGLTVLAVPDVENTSSRFSLAAEHPTYQDVATTNPAFNTMTSKTQEFAALLGGALSLAAGNASTNQAFTAYTPPGDDRSYITFSVDDVEYYVVTQTSYLALVA